MCLVTVDVTSSTVGTHTNESGDLTSSAGNSGTATDNLIVAADRPGFTKSFSPNPIPLGGRSTLTFTIDNSANGSLAFDLSFTDNLPPGMVVADPANVSNTCFAGGIKQGTVTAVPGTGVVTLTPDDGVEGAVEEGSSCTVSVDVIGTDAGLLANTTGELTSIIFPPGATRSSGKASATLEVTVDPLSLTKSFTDDPVPPGGAVTLLFTIDNFDRNDDATAISFTDDLTTIVPALAGLTFASLLSNDCGGTVSGVGGTTVGFSGGTLSSGATCAIEVSLSVPPGATPGSYTNTTDAITGTVGVSPVIGNMASDDLFVEPAPLLTKSFTDDPVGAGGTVTLEFTITNTSPSSMATDIAFTDVFDPVLPTAATLPTDGFCGSVSTATFTPLLLLTPPFDNILARLDVSGAELAGGASCTFSVTLDVAVGAGGGAYPNTTSAITAMVGGMSLTGNPASDNLVVVATPSLLKEFTDDPVDPGGTVTLEFTLTHDLNAGGDATGITFSDDLAAAIPGLAGIGLPLNDLCGPGNGSLTGTAMDTLLTFPGATLMPGEVCTFSVTLDVPAAATAGAHANTTSNVMATVQGLTAMENAASDDLIISGLTFTKEFTDDPVIPGDTVTLTFTLDNMSPTEDATSIMFNDNLGNPGDPGPTLLGLVAVAPLPSTPCGGGSALTGTGFLEFTDGNLLAGESCTFDVTVQVPAGAAPNMYNNTTGSLSANLDGTTVGFPPANDVLTVTSGPLLLTKSFTSDPVAPGGAVTLEFSLSNMDASQTVTNINFTDDLDAALTGLMATGLPMANICGAGSQITGTDSLSFAGGSLAGGATCTFSVTILVPSGAPAGTAVTNITSTVTGEAGGLTVTADPATDDLRIDVLAFSKAFDSTAEAGGAVTLSFTIQNLSTTEGASDLAFADNLDMALSGLVATSLPAAPCGAGSVLAGTSVLILTGGNLLPGGSCTFSVDLQVPAASPAGSFLNVTSDLRQGGVPVAESATATLVVTVSANQAPIADAGADQNVSTGNSASVQVTLDGSGSSDPDGDPLTFTWTGSFGTLSGMIVNPFLDPGTHTVTLTVADGKGGADTDTVQISVSDGRPPKITVSPSSLMFTLEETSAPPAASASLLPARPVDAETASKPFTLSVERGAVNFRILPGDSWVRAAPDSGQLTEGVVRRILAVVDPAGLPAGTYTAPLFIRAGARIAARLNVTLVITPGSAPPELTVTTGSPLPNGAVGSPYNGMLSATGGSPPLSWSTAGGALPPGLVLNPASGAIGGTPTAPGVFSWVAIVTDAEGLSAAKAFSIQIAPDPSQQPRLGVRPGRSSFSFVPQSPAETQTGSISNDGGAPISFQIDSMRLSGSPWLSVSPLSGELPPGARIPLTIRADPRGFAPGTYLADIVFSSPGGADFSVSVSMTITRRPQRLRVSQRGLTFTAVSGGGQVPPQSFQVLNDGLGVMPWNIGVTTLTVENWLAVTPLTGVSESSRPATVDVQVNTQGLTSRAYYGLLEVAAPDAANSPQFVTLVLNLLPPDRDPGPIVMPLGLIFATPPGGPAPPSQSVRISILTPQPLPFTVQALTLSGGAWLGPVSAEGTVVPGESAVISVEVVPGELAPGIYRGLLQLLFDGELSRTVDVVLVVFPVSTASANPAPVFQDGCNRAQLAPVFRLLGGISPIPAGWPASVEVEVVDNCAAKMTAGSVVMDFANIASPSLALGHSGSGLWAATWNVPAAADPDSMAIVTVTATDPEGISGALTQGLSVSPNSSLPPRVAPGGVVHGASFVLDPLAPGTIVSIFGSNLSSEPVSGGGRSASSVPLPTELAGTQIILGGRPLPILFSREDQVNAVLPFEVADRLNESLPLLVRRTDAGSLGVPEPVFVSAARPGVFTRNASGSGPGSIQNASFQTVTPARPVQAGDAIIIYGTGLGAVFPEVASGDPAPASPLARTARDVTVTIGGRPATVLFAGLTPGFTSLYQVNAVVPAGLPAGEAELVVSIAGQASPAVTLAVE